MPVSFFLCGKMFCTTYCQPYFRLCCRHCCFFEYIIGNPINSSHQILIYLMIQSNYFHSFTLFDYVFKKAAVPTAEPEIWLTSEELAELLKISTRTLQRMRKERTIPYCMIRSKCLYRFSDVEKCISQRIVSCNPQTLDEFRESYRTTHESTSRWILH